MKLSHKLLLILAVAAALTLGSCSSRKHTTPAVPVEPSLEQLLTDYIATPRTWQSVEMPISVNLVSPARFSASGRLTMVKDRAVRISIRVLGMEMGVLYADNDSVLVTVKPMKMAYSESMRRFTANTGLSLSDLQCVLLGQAFVPGNGAVASRRGLTVSAGETDVLMFGTSAGETDLVFRLRRQQELPVLFMTQGVNGDVNINVAYDGPFTETPAGVISRSATATAIRDAQTVEAGWTLKPGDARWDRQDAIDAPRIPSDYRRMTTEQLLNILRNRK